MHVMKAKTPAYLLVGLALLSILPKIYAQDGVLDATYGAGGRVLLPQTGFYSSPFLALDAQNRAVVCSSVDDAYYAARLLTNGQLDASFGNAGVVAGPLEDNLSQDITFAMALPGNRTLMVLNAYGQDTLDETRLVALDAAGQLDAAFGNGGILRLDLNPGLGEEYLISGGVQPDGKIVLAGYVVDTASDLPQGVVLRFNSDGTPDATFNGTGRFNAPSLLFISLFSSVVLQNDGKMVVTGLTVDLLTQSFQAILLRLNANGQLDFTFGTAGIVRLSALSDRVNIVGDMERTADNKLLLTGFNFLQPDSIRVVRLNANGTLDGTFGTGGVVSFLPSGAQLAAGNKCAVQPDGKVLVLAQALIDSTTFESGYALVRLLSNGQLDTTFGNRGVVLEKNNQQANDMALQKIDGKILLCGEYVLPTDEGFFVHRYNNNSVSIRETRLDLGQVRVYPNPAREQTTVQFDLAEPQRFQIELLDVQGRTQTSASPMRTWEAGVNALPVSLPALPAGLYWLRFRSESGQSLSVPLTVMPR